MKNNKLSKNFVEWLWAVNRRKENEYYQKNYGFGEIKFDAFIGGSIVKEYFLENAELLQKAYSLLFASWNSVTYDVFNSTGESRFKVSYELHFDEITWLLFKALAYQLEKDYISSLVNCDFFKVWEHLDRLYGVE